MRAVRQLHNQAVGCHAHEPRIAEPLRLTGRAMGPPGVLSAVEVQPTPANESAPRRVATLTHYPSGSNNAPYARFAKILNDRGKHRK
jgi:hypothetical protein